MTPSPELFERLAAAAAADAARRPRRGRRRCWLAAAAVVVLGAGIGVTSLGQPARAGDRRTRPSPGPVHMTVTAARVDRRHAR